MQVAKWRPWGISSIQDEVNRLFDDVLRGDGRLGLLEERWAPPLDIAETGDDIVVKAEVPGMDAKDLHVSVQGNILTIQGERKSEAEEKGKSFHRVERAFGQFTRTVQLPSEVNGEKVRATYRNGILELHLPKREEAKTREIKINVD